MKCTNSGCNQEYSTETNHDNACCYHDGNPIFHEGLKGWSCCQKRVINFDDLFTITGCKTGPHLTIEKNKLPNFYQVH